MRTATFISYISFFLFAFFAVAHAMPEPVQVGSIVVRDDDDTVPAEDGLGEDDGLEARDGDHHKYCWNHNGWDKCSKWGYCCKKYQTCCGGKKCCNKGYKCYRKDYHDDDGHHKRGDDNHHGHHGYEWVCKKDHHW